MKNSYLALLFCLSTCLQAQTNKITTASCNNADFETGDFTGWAGGIGYNQNSFSELNITNNSISTLGINSAEPSCSFHTLVTGAGIDPYGRFPVVGPGNGTYGLRLGGENININQQIIPDTYSCQVNATGNAVYSNGEMIEQKIVVTPANSLFLYNYAVVLQDGAHPAGEQSYFKIEVLDASGSIMGCFSDTFFINNGKAPAGFSVSSINSSVYYQSWKTASVNLMAYVGQDVTVRFTAAGCTHGDHFGYAYIDCDCGALDIIIPAPFCSGGNCTLIAPPGYSYQWFGPGIVGSSTTQSIKINAQGTYSVNCTSAGGCTFGLDTTVYASPAVSITVSKDTVCAGSPVILTAGGANTYTWSANAGGAMSNTVSVSPLHDTLYAVTGTDSSGCIDAAKKNVYVTACATDMRQLINSLQLVIYPNPANNLINMATTQDITEIKLFDVLGNNILSTKEKVIDVSNLAEGIYFIEVQTSEGVLTKKIIVQR
jgi:hypothetical protein